MAPAGIEDRAEARVDRIQEFVRRDLARRGDRECGNVGLAGEVAAGPTQEGSELNGPA
jgi:hypothetical protein